MGMGVGGVRWEGWKKRTQRDAGIEVHLKGGMET